MSQSPGRKPQFSIGKTLFWTAVVAGGLTVLKVSETNSTIDPFFQAISLGFYLVVVCGILSFWRAAKSFDVWFPTGMNIFIPAALGLDVLLRELSILDNFLEPFNFLLAIGGIPYGIFLLVLNARRIYSGQFSISILGYHLGSWLGWIAIWTLWFLAENGAFL